MYVLVCVCMRYSSVTVESCSSADGPCRLFRINAVAMPFRHVRMYAWLSWPEVVRMYSGRGHAELMVEGAQTITFLTDYEDKK